MRALAACALVMLLPMAAAAQTPDAQTDPQASEQTPVQPPPAPSRGPMVIEQVHNGFLITPEVKATLFDKQVKPATPQKMCPQRVHDLGIPPR